MLVEQRERGRERGAVGCEGGFWSLVANDWQFLMECSCGWLTIFLFSSSHSPLILFHCVYLSIAIPHSLAGGRLNPPDGLIVLHVFIQAFMATSSSRRLISSVDDGSLPRLSLLFIIGDHSYHISLTLGRWFSHWTTLPDRHITNLLRRGRHIQSNIIVGAETSKQHFFCRFNSIWNATWHVHVTFRTTFIAFHLFTLIFTVGSVMSSDWWSMDLTRTYVRDRIWGRVTQPQLDDITWIPGDKGSIRWRVLLGHTVWTRGRGTCQSVEDSVADCHLLSAAGTV